MKWNSYQPVLFLILRDISSCKMTQKFLSYFIMITWAEGVLKECNEKVERDTIFYEFKLVRLQSIT